MTPTDAAARTERRILTAMEHLWVDGEVYELRIIRKGKPIISGYYNDLQAFAADAAQLDGTEGVTGIYWTINAVDPRLFERAPNRIRDYTPKGEATADTDIVRRRFLPLDIDSVRDVNPASHEEHCEAVALQGRIADSDFMSALGFPAPIEMDSGNGAYLLYPLDLPNTEETRDMIKGCLEALASKFDTEAARVDTSVHNASRIMRVPGTLNSKGTETEERYHRRCLLTVVPGVTL